MRILCVEPGPYFSVRDVHVGWVEAFKALGCTVGDLNFNDRLGFYSRACHVNDAGELVKSVPDPVNAVRMAAKGILAACMEMRPDVVFITSCFFVPIDTIECIRAAGIRVVINHLESPYEDDRQWTRAQHVDLNLINDPTNLDQFPAGTVYMPAAYRPTVHRPGDGEALVDFAFVGTAFPSRVEFFEQVDFGDLDVALAGNWSSLTDEHPLRKHVVHDIAHCIDNDEAVRLYQSALTSANLYRVEAERDGLVNGWACSPREIELAAVGCWFARQARPESDLLFPMLPTFATPEELGDIVRWACAHDDEREAAANQARAAIADRMFENNAKRLLALLDA